MRRPEVTKAVVETFHTSNWSSLEVTSGEEQSLYIKADTYIDDREELQEIIVFLTTKLLELKERKADND